MRREVVHSENIGLAWNFRVNPSSCENPEHYENYIKYCALADKQSGLNVTHLFIDKDETGEELLCGYVTLKATALIREDDGVKLGFPALEISELAVDERFERLGLGTTMVMFAIVFAAALREKSLGIQYVTLCADPKAVTFYEREVFGFAKIRDYDDIPREGWNKTCTPMFVKIN